jgi:N-acetylglucosaminyl-diphospho-decaprenol L-rhamnosyltransferase
VSDLSVVVVTHNASGHLERCLESVANGPHEVIVVDNASSDMTPDLVRRWFPSVRLIELPENIGFGAANNVGMEAAAGRWHLLLNSDAWPRGDGIERLRAFADANPQVGVAGPRLVSPDGRVQKSVRGFPTLWRLATEYFFLRHLAPRSRLLNEFYGAGFDYRSRRPAEFLVGAVLLLRREAVDEVGGFDPAFFMFSEEVDLCYRMRAAGWAVEFTPEAEFVHLGGASTTPIWDRMFREQLRSHLRFLAKHGSLERAERARRLLVAALRLRGLVFRGERRRVARAAAAWLASSTTESLLESTQ